MAFPKPLFTNIKRIGKQPDIQEKTKHISKWEAQETAFRTLKERIRNMPDGTYVSLISALTMLPDDTLVNVHFQYMDCNKAARFRHVTVKEAWDLVPACHWMERVTAVSHDLDYGGPDKARPVVILEIPRWQDANKW